MLNKSKKLEYNDAKFHPLKQIVKYISLLFIIQLLFACNEKQNKVEYAFFTAGHAYGNPNHYQYGFHPPLDSAISYLNNYLQMELGIFTVDVVPQPTRAGPTITTTLNRCSKTFPIGLFCLRAMWAVPMTELPACTIKATTSP